MKKIKGKYIRLTEEQLNEIVKKAVEKHVSMLMEYAIPRSKFIDNVWHLARQIIENWCLVHYCTLTNRTMTKEHWAKELRTHMTNIALTPIKGNNSADARKKAIKEGFNVMELFNGTEVINNVIFQKFTDENIDVSSKEYAQTVEDCFAELDKIIEVIASYTSANIIAYSNSI